MPACVCKQALSENSVAGMMRDPLIATSHVAIIICGLLREYLRDRGERCGEDAMTYERGRRNRVIDVEDHQV